jgi:uracil-DNA glycosylase
VYITSPVKYLPEHGTPTDDDISHGRLHLRQEIDVVDPRLIILLGSVAARTCLNKRIRILSRHGDVVQRDGRLYFITLHPAAALHNPSLGSVLTGDFQLLAPIIDGLPKGLELRSSSHRLRPQHDSEGYASPQRTGRT